MTWVRFFFKLLIAMLGPAALALAALMLEPVLFPKSRFTPTHVQTVSEDVFGVLVFGLLLLSIALPLLLIIREIQNHSSSGESPLQLTTLKTSTDKLWK